MSRKPTTTTNPTRRVQSAVATPRKVKPGARADHIGPGDRAAARPAALEPAQLPMLSTHQDLAHRMGDLFAAAAQTQRAHMLACLLRPLNALSLVGVAAGAFAEFLTHKPRADDPSDLDAVSRFSPDQISALSDFVDQVDHQAVIQAAVAAAPRSRTKRRHADGGR